jgi:formate hydrogenlyase subunit 4
VIATLPRLTAELADTALAVAAAPLWAGWIGQCRAWLLNRPGPGVLQPYRDLRKLFAKTRLLPEGASVLFRIAPALEWALLALALGLIPAFTARPLLDRAGDAIVFVGILAAARFVSVLAASDLGTPFGGLGARRTLLVGFLAEPALLIVLMTAALAAGGTTSLAAIARALTARPPALDPSLAFAAAAFAMVFLAENARLPVDNPATHLELTMIHEALVLEYTGPDLALLEWSGSLKLLALGLLGLVLFVPWALPAPGAGAAGLLRALLLEAGLLAALGALLALAETASAKLRLFRVPAYLSTAFLVATIGLLVRLVPGLGP